ncbi:MAG: hypothetical protein ACJ788_05445, partial [Ktedonobacteraceae bacterium]
ADVLHARVRRLASLVGLGQGPFPNECGESERQQEPPRLLPRGVSEQQLPIGSLVYERSG